MQRLLFVLVLIAVVVVGLGFYLGWFHIGSENVDGKSNVTLSVDTNKMHHDEKTAEADLKGMGHQIKEKVATTGEKITDGTVVAVSGDKLTMTTDGKEQSHTLAANVKVTCDGKICKAADLKPGMRVRVTVENGDAHAATKVEALDAKPDFEKGI